MRYVIGFSTLVLLLASATWAQQDLRLSAPKTKLEAFDAQSGAVILRGFSEIGVMKGAYGGSVTVECKEFVNASTGQREFGISFQVKEASRLETKKTSYIDYDEIPSLLKGIDYIAKIDKSVTKLENFQADYKTKGDLRISTFSTQSGEIMVAISSGTIGSATVYLKVTDLQELRELVASAQDRIETIKN
jgi:hypothetical protein